MLSGKKKAVLRICASCCWVWMPKTTEEFDCPRCGFASYRAYRAVGRRAYYARYDQHLWLEQVVSRIRANIEKRCGEMPAKLRRRQQASAKYWLKVEQGY